MTTLRPCPRCGRPEGLTYCPDCHGKREKALAEAHEAAVRMSWRRMPTTPSYIDREDMVQAAMVAAVRAWDRFDETSGASFVQFAWTRLAGAMSDLVRQEVAWRGATRTDHTTCLDSFERSRRGGAIGDGLDEAEGTIGEMLVAKPDTYGVPSVAAIEAVVDELPAKQARALRLHVFEERTLRETGEHLGVTESRACQLVMAARKALRASGRFEYAVATA